MSVLMLRAERTRFSNRIDILAMTKEGYIGKPLEMVKHDDGSYCPPTLTISESEAQQLMDDLWQAGLRPTEGSGSAGALSATQKHLEDMRSLVFDGTSVVENVEKQHG